MEINDRTYVSIDYTLKLDSGETVDQTTPENPFGFVFGAGQVIKGLEDGIRGKKAGDELSLTISPQEWTSSLVCHSRHNHPTDPFVLRSRRLRMM